MRRAVLRKTRAGTAFDGRDAVVTVRGKAMREGDETRAVELDDDAGGVVALVTVRPRTTTKGRSGDGRDGEREEGDEEDDEDLIVPLRGTRAHAERARVRDELEHDSQPACMQGCRSNDARQ